MKGKQMTLTPKQRELMSAAELAEFDRWNEIVEEMDRKDARKEKRLQQKKDGADITLADRDDDNEYLDISRLFKLSCDTDYLEIIFSQRYEDIHELITDEAKAKIVKGLTDRQKQIFFLTEVQRLKTKDAAKILKTTSRNILKVKETAAKNARRQLQD
jgi:DNA-directed RNA polymerase specialized sigma24 family protein